MRWQASLTLLCGLIIAAPASAAPFIDDFTSKPPPITASPTAPIGISGGVLTANNGSTTSTSVNVVHNNTAQLAVGEYAAVDINSNAREVMLIVSTTQSHPNASGPSGIRLSAFSTDQSVRARAYGSGTSTTSETNYPGIGGVEELYIFRDTETSFRVGYDNGGGLEFLGGSLTVPNTTGVAGMFVGLQFFHNVQNSNFVVDNLRIAEVPEPTALSLMALGALLGLRRRRA